MIVKGKFNALSMAIYGDIVSEPPPVQKYEPKPLPSVESIPLSRAVDPSNSSDPTLLAKQLLSLIPDSPPLPLVVRLMFCMKPSNEDWELPDFPYLHADLDGEVEEDFDLQAALRWTSRPVQDDTSLETLSRFAVRVASCIGQKVCSFDTNTVSIFNVILLEQRSSLSCCETPQYLGITASRHGPHTVGMLVTYMRYIYPYAKNIF